MSDKKEIIERLKMIRESVYDGTYSHAHKQLSKLISELEEAE